MIMISDDSIRLRESNQAHHPRAYQALWQTLKNEPDVFARRRQLDHWLKQHGHSLTDGERWENEFLTTEELTKAPVEQYDFNHQTLFVDWRSEYCTVVGQALRNGFFYSDAFQKQLYHTYIETERLSLNMQQAIHQRALSDYQSRLQTQMSQNNTMTRRLIGCLLHIPLLKRFIEITRVT
jgi:hypothetical protein